MEIYFQAGRRTTKGGGRGVGIFFLVAIWIVGFGLGNLDWGDAKNGTFPFDFFVGLSLVTHTF